MHAKRSTRVASTGLCGLLFFSSVSLHSLAQAREFEFERLATIELNYPQFDQPVAVAMGPLGQLYVADLGRGTVVRIDSTGSVAFEFETPSRQPDLQPLDLEVTGFKVYVLDAGSNALLRYSEEGAFLDLLQSFAEEDVETPRSLSVDGVGRVLLANPARHRARIISETQQTETVVGDFGSRPGELSSPAGAAFAPDGSFYVADAGNKRIQRYSGVGNLERIYLKELGEPRGLAVGAGGDLLVADPERRSLHAYDATGRVHTILELPDMTPTDVCILRDLVWVLSIDPPALIQVRFVRGE